MDTTQLATAESSRRWARTSVALNWKRLGVRYARLALGAAFLSGIASRFGLYGKNVGYGNFANFVEYTAEVNSFMPAFSIPFLAWSATGAESVLGIALILGVWPRSGSACKRSASGAVRHRHGRLFWDQISAGLFGVLCLGGSRVTCPVREPQTGTWIMNSVA
jgi:DoxX